MTALPNLTRDLIRSVRRNMNTQGFALVDTSEYLTDKVWPSQRSDVFKTLNSKSGGHYISLKECSTAWIKTLIQWQSRLLKAALPKEDFKLRGHSLSLRNERHRNDNVCTWHLDGAYIRSICVVKGSPTQVMTKLGESHVPLGWTLFITARERVSSMKIPGTLHRRPRLKKLRRVIVNGWE